MTFTEGTFDISYGYAPDPIIEANSLTVIINDVPRTFNTIIVNETKVYDGRTLLKVTAIRDNNLSEIISFETYEGSVGMNQIQYFTYIKNNVSYQGYWSAIKSVVQANSNRKLTGSFNGEISNWDNASQQSNTIKFTEGSFKIAY